MKEVIDVIKSVIGGLIFFLVFSIRRALLTINNFLKALGVSTLLSLLGSVLFASALIALFVKGFAQPELVKGGLILLASAEYLLLSICVYIVAATLIYAIADAAASFFVGAKEAREHGFQALFAKVWDVICMRDFAIEREQEELRQQQTTQQVNQLLPVITQLLAILGRHERVTVSDFNSLRLSDEEINALVANTPSPLEDNEAGFSHDRYKTLKNLNTAETSVLLEPIPNSLSAENYDTNNPPVILCKQYKKDNQWHAVPMFSSIYLKNEIKACFERDARCPTTRDAITAPTRYTDALGVECETRYVWHPYYLPSAPLGVCQERNELIQALRTNPFYHDVVSEPTPIIAPVPSLVDLNLGGTRFSIYRPEQQAANNIVDSLASHLL